ncbi:MAG: LDL receptor domain-containing protein [Deltaproteobacteria bacterium]|nr:LDL receptor domain-containing protein [Deltaproteobacteria bacterium]
MGTNSTFLGLGCMAAVLCLSTSCADREGRNYGAGPQLGDDPMAEGDCEAPPGQSCSVPLCEDPCGYNDPYYDSEPCRIDSEVAADDSLECEDTRGVKILFQEANATVPAPNAFFRSKDSNLQSWIEQRWNEAADFVLPQAVETKIENTGVTVHNYPAGNDWTRTDFHGAIMALPEGERPENLLKSLLNDPIKLTNNGSFSGWVGWPAANGDREVGDVIDLDIFGPDNGAIAYWKIDVDRFCVITVENDNSGWHPVSGIRCWGYVPIQVNPNWKQTDNRWNCGRPTYMFYTIGIDSPSVPGGGTFGGVGAQQSTWNALMRDLSIENHKKGGVSGRWMLQKTVAQPNALEPNGTTNVKPPGQPEPFYVNLPKNFRDGEVCDAPSLSCDADQFTCADASCIAGGRRCDGTPDCLDGDDEEACDGGNDGANGCEANQWSCTDGACIPADWRCDGEYEDCAAGEDEQGCEDAPAPSGCEASEYTCDDGSCIPGAWRCDGEYTDCPGGEDEQGCPGGGDNDPGDSGSDTCSASEWTCDDGSCIPDSWHCDGEYNDCPSGEDEQQCGDSDGNGSGGGNSCAADEWTCNDGACIPADWQCDGQYTDCAGGEDEDDCSDPGGDGGDSGSDTCGADQWACNDGSCIADSWHCDVIVDCPDGEDELGC